MNAADYINERLNFVINETRKTITKWQDANSYLLHIDPYAPDNWANAYLLFRNDKQFLTDVSILFNGYTLDRDMQTGNNFDLGKVLIEELQNNHDLACYHYQQLPKLRVVYDSNRPQSNYFKAIDIYILCHTYVGGGDQTMPPEELLSKSDHELKHNVVEKRSIFHYYLIFMLFQARFLPKPLSLITTELETYFTNNLIGDSRKITKFRLEEKGALLLIVPEAPYFEDYNGENDREIEAIGVKYNVRLMFTPDIYHHST
ncbi:hypothetical protein KBC03_07720 [Patescibacteria group bacterium]|nr:hypothetical protein [Patescibacteria group bacterium]